MLRCFFRLSQCRSGIAAVEFALIAPILITLLLGIIEYSKYNLVHRRGDFAVQMLAEYLSRDPDNFLTAQERHQAQDIWMMVNPTADGADEFTNSGWQRGYSFAWAAVEFIPADPSCQQTGCDFDPQTDWAFHVDYGVTHGVRTACDLDIVSNSTQLDGSNVPEGVVGRASIVLADIVFPYRSLLGGGVVPVQEVYVNAIRKTRSAAPLGHFIQGANYMDWCP